MNAVVVGFDRRQRTDVGKREVRVTQAPEANAEGSGNPAENAAGADRARLFMLCHTRHMQSIGNGGAGLSTMPRELLRKSAWRPGRRRSGILKAANTNRLTVYSLRAISRAISGNGASASLSADSPAGPTGASGGRGDPDVAPDETERRLQPRHAEPAAEQPRHGDEPSLQGEGFGVRTTLRQLEQPRAGLGQHAGERQNAAARADGQGRVERRARSGEDAKRRSADRHELRDLRDVAARFLDAHDVRSAPPGAPPRRAGCSRRSWL